MIAILNVVSIGKQHMMHFDFQLSGVMFYYPKTNNTFIAYRDISSIERLNFIANNVLKGMLIIYISRFEKNRVNVDLSQRYLVHLPESNIHAI